MLGYCGVEGGMFIRKKGSLFVNIRDLTKTHLVELIFLNKDRRNQIAIIDEI